MRRQREYEEEQALIVKNGSPTFGLKKGSHPDDIPGDNDEYMLSTEEQLEARDYVETLGNSQNSPRPSNNVAISQ